MKSQILLAIFQHELAFGIDGDTFAIKIIDEHVGVKIGVING